MIRAGRFSARRSTVHLAGFAGQLVNALTSLVLTYIASLLLDLAAFGEFALGFAVVVLWLSAIRSFVGTTILAVLPSLRGGDRATGAGAALAAATVAGGVGALMILVLAWWWSWPFAVFALFLPVAAWQDAARHLLIADTRGAEAARSDLVWLGVQSAMLLVVHVQVADPTTGHLALAWGTGACAASATLARRARWGRGGPRWWLRHAGGLSWRYGASGLMGQLEVYGVLFVVGAAIGATSAGDLRLAQLFAYQPVMLALGALTLQLTAAFARSRDTDLTARLLRTAVALTTPFVVLSAGIILLRGTVADLLAPDAENVAPLMVPLACETVLVALAVPAFAALQGWAQATPLLRLALCRLALKALVVGSPWLGAGVLTTVWTLTAIQGLYLGAVWVAFLRNRPRAESAAQPGP